MYLPQLRNEKKTNDAQLEDLENKYKLRMERLLSQQSEADKTLESRRKEHADIHKDLASLKAFRADEAKYQDIFQPALLFSLFQGKFSSFYAFIPSSITLNPHFVTGQFFRFG